MYTQIKEGSSFRPSYNVAHRGLPKQTHEKSISGTKKAIEVGATHVELDAYVTKDLCMMVQLCVLLMVKVL